MKSFSSQWGQHTSMVAITCNVKCNLEGESPSTIMVKDVIEEKKRTFNVGQFHVNSGVEWSATRRPEGT